LAGANTSKEPKPLVLVATDRNLTCCAPRRSAAAAEATTMAAPPSPGEQNMYCVSGSLTIGAAATASSVSASRRHALGLMAPLRNALAATLARVRSEMPCSRM
jgi:hypothetical protein